MIKFNMMVGIPGSGKTTYAKDNLFTNNTVYLSSDEIRINMFGFEDQTHNQEVFERMQRETIEALKCGFDIIYDATNLNAKRRKTIIDRVKKINGVVVNAYLMCTPINILLERNMTRPERKLPWDKLELLIKSIEPPMYYEGFDNIYLINDKYYQHKNYLDFFKECFGFNQDNPHHKEDLYQHIDLVTNNIKDNDIIELQAARYHDFGKLYTKQKKEEKGYSVYYGHEKVSTYLFLCSSSKQRLLDGFDRVKLNEIDYQVAALILNHMEWYKREDMTPIRERLGEELFKKLEILHEADMKGSIKYE